MLSHTEGGEPPATGKQGPPARASLAWIVMMRSRPDVLVLGGGGVLGEAWMMGVLAGIEDATGFDLRDCDYYVGTSAGAIVAAHLAAGQSPRRPPVYHPRYHTCCSPASSSATKARTS